MGCDIAVSTFINNDEVSYLRRGDKVKEKDFYKRRGLLSCFIKAIPEMDMDRYNRITREQLLTILDLVKTGHGYEKCKEDQPSDEKDILSLINETNFTTHSLVFEIYL